MVCGTFIGLGTFFLYFSMFQLDSGPSGTDPANEMLLVISGLVYILCYMFLGPFAGASVTGVTQGFVRGEAALSLRQAFQLAIRFGGQTLATVWIKWILILGAMIVPLTPGLLVGLAGWWQVALVFLLPGGLVSLGFGIFFYVRFFLAVPVILEENIAYWGALKRSWQLTRWSFWRIFGLLILLVLILYVFNMLPSLVQVLLLLSVETFFSPGWFWFANLVQALLMAILTALLTAPAWMMAALVYFERRTKKEGMDLIEETDRLEGSAL